MRQISVRVAALVALAAALAAQPALSGDIIGGDPHFMKGNILKYSQPIGHLIDPNVIAWHGENIPSDVDWTKVMNATAPIPPNWVIADDFQDDFDTPVTSVRWWGSYFGPTFDSAGNPIFGPGSEDGYVISFFKDIPADPNGIPFSRPGELLGTYLLDFKDVWVEETPHIGWDDHRIFEYKANLMDAHLDHPTDLSDQMGFHQRPGEIYWISIMAEVGHKLERITHADGSEEWVDVPTGKFAEPNPQNQEGHFWGWHTSPVRFNDVATMGHLLMPEKDWLYEGWQPIQPRHELLDMAFELYTIPEPASFVLLGLAVSWLGLLARRRS